MTTTVAIQEKTLEMLEAFKDETKAKSFDEVINKLLLQSKKSKKSYFGAIPNLGKFKREEIDRLA